MKEPLKYAEVEPIMQTYVPISAALATNIKSYAVWLEREKYKLSKRPGQIVYLMSIRYSQVTETLEVCRIFAFFLKKKKSDVKSKRMKKLQF